ncbi:MAG: 16S rRNA (cytidine(1402)-2'-O)-methyltransferase [Clostridia bacterium]|nr:16S rRNA (cytidine(1402)-2'-O)-methyltransferase [Clostridia bacterium]
MAKLFIVGTPIGNLNDITLRAIDTLKNVDVIACEDTRHSLPLLNHFDIKAKLVAYHKFNEVEMAGKIVDMIHSGQSVAIITDAGMPSISDPGAELIAKCRKLGVETELVPGPTALASAITLSGTKAQGFTFVGFLPEKTADKKALISRVKDTGLPIVMYVAPHDLVKTAGFLFEELGDRTVHVCRELTKVHECVEDTTLKDFHAEERGEIVLIVDASEQANPLLEMNVEDHLRHYFALGYDQKSAVKTVAQERSLPKNDVYQVAINLK